LEGVYGSVGEFVAGVGKFTSLLTLNVDYSAGELLFVSDTFFRSGHKYQMNGDDSSMYNKFMSYLNKCDFKVEDISGKKDAINPLYSKVAYVYRGSVMELNKKLLKTWDIPQFRFVALDIESESNSAISLSSLILSSCLLRNGGILVIDGLDSPQSREHVVSSITHYLSVVKSNVFTPFLYARNKLFLTTSDYKLRYIKYIALHSESILKVSLKEITNSNYGRQFTYLLIE